MSPSRAAVPLWQGVGMRRVVAAALGAAVLSLGMGADAGAGVSSVRSQSRSCVPAGEAIRVMPLGDSLTSGLHWDSNNDDSYRPYLWQMLRAAGIRDVDFVGTFTTGDGSYDGDHQGRGGYSTGPDNGFADADGVVRSNLAYWISQYRPESGSANNGTGQDWVTWSRPDVVLLNIGTNDGEADAAKVYRRLNGLVELIRARAPGAVVVVSSVPPNGYDRAVFGLVGDAAQRIASQSDGRVIYADIYARMRSGNTALDAAPFETSDWNAPDDHVHFSASGGRKFAAAWYPTVLTALTMARCDGAAAPTSAAVPVTVPVTAAPKVAVTTKSSTSTTRKPVAKTVKKTVRKKKVVRTTVRRR